MNPEQPDDKPQENQGSTTQGPNPQALPPQPIAEPLPQRVISQPQAELSQPPQPKPTGQVTIGMDGGTSSTPRQTDKKKIAVISILIIVGIALVGGALYALLTQDSSSDKTTSQTEEKTEMSQLADQQGAEDVDRKNNLENAQMQLEVYFNNIPAENATGGHYPSFAEINDPAFRQANLLDTMRFDPSSTTETFADKPGSSVFAYMPIPVNCNNTTVFCTGYSLIATLTSGERYELKAVNNEE